MAARILVVDDSSTIRRVVQRTLERAGFETLLAADGREALEQVQRQVPDLVLVDQFMPHMDGTQFCESMRSIKNVRHVPVVLMSAKADQIGEEFVRRTGAIDAITKPFFPEALLAVTNAALARAAESTPPPADVPEPDPQEQTPSADELRTEAADRIAELLATTLAPAIRGLIARGGELSETRLARAIADGLPTGQLFELAGSLRNRLPGERGETSFEGRTDHVALGELLQMLQHQRQTGVLEIHSAGHGGKQSADPPDDGRSVLVCLREGMVDIALGRGSAQEFLLGRYLLEEDLVEREDLEMLLKYRKSPRHLLGSQLVKLGYITISDLRTALVRQSSELLYEALRWPNASFRFERWASRPEAAEARLGLPIASVLMEGLRRVDEWRLIEEQIHDFDMVLVERRDAVDELALEDLSPEEHRVLSAVNGERNVHQILEHTAMGSFETCKVLFQLVTSGLVRGEPVQR